MKVETREWVRCAEEDLEVALTQFRRRTKKPTTNAICFHCQQCAEKYLKARLAEAGLSILKVHDLVLLLQRLLPSEPLWASFAPMLRGLNDYAVKFRYPGHIATRAHRHAGGCASGVARVPLHSQRNQSEPGSAATIRFKPHFNL
jgi:HEPN domain-containing protein